MKIYHIVIPETWELSMENPYYEALSLETEGFIHCSFANQVEVVLDRYYKKAGKVLILEIESDKLTSKYVEEPSTNGEIYPHIYGKINRDAIIGVSERDN